MFRPHRLPKLRMAGSAPSRFVRPGQALQWRKNSCQRLTATRSFSMSFPRREASNPDPATAAGTQSDVPSHSQPHSKRRHRGILYAAAFLLIGTTLGSIFRITVSPPPHPLPGSEEDQFLVSQIRAKAATLPLVQSLSSDPEWTSWDAYSEAVPRRPHPRVTEGAMGGSRGLAYQRIFHKKETGELLNVVYVGGGLSGWPGVAHGGALATVLDETLGRCAILSFPSKTGVTAKLDLSYRYPTMTNAFYVIRTKPMDDMNDPETRHRKMWVEGYVEDQKGRRCVEAKALFVVPKSTQLIPIADGF